MPMSALARGLLGPPVVKRGSRFQRIDGRGPITSDNTKYACFVCFIEPSPDTKLVCLH